MADARSGRPQRTGRAGCSATAYVTRRAASFSSRALARSALRFPLRQPVLDELGTGESEALPIEPGRRNVVRLTNLYKAKGLEAPVVILADPPHTFEFPIYLRVERTGASATGHLRLARKNKSGWGSTTVAQPAGWDAHEAEEKKYVAAERLRLLYVAGTRAQDLLIVSRLADAGRNKPWGDFEGYLSGEKRSIAVR